ncbi:hypothetical protein S7335_3586 [Synechococcus sp. PCC 7335]|uniref:hypothetical protein n=1 Tax=Synechococcus sp. (strain ATCC 29403 / PCC 7335) TaxID=91464 RepID=UPI00017EC01E|nr:hypothetical protein [Synechococcus sp. PCC 7335]EDX85883.1 hypothetical protein S7335_3586 [Synechococcus sp. PCC 7335]
MSTSSDKYKREIMKDLAGGNKEILEPNGDDALSEKYKSFDDFADRSSRDERHGLLRRAFHPERVPAAQMDPELRSAIEKIKPNERDDVAREFFKHFKERGLSDRDLERQLGLSTHRARKMNADDVGKLASFAYTAHPDIFQEVLADQPAILKFLSNPLVGAAIGAIASKWLRK